MYAVKNQVKEILHYVQEDKNRAQDDKIELRTTKIELRTTKRLLSITAIIIIKHCIIDKRGLSMPTHKILEDKLAKKASAIYELFPEQKREYDDQNICTVFISPEELKEKKLTDLFPESKNGLTVHFFGSNYTPYPPLHYMASERIKSLCKAYSHIDKDSIEEIHYSQQGLLKNIDLGQNFNIGRTDNVLMNEVTEKTIRDLYNIYTTKPQNKKSFSEFSHELLTEAAHVRSNEADILTFNELNQTFSYEHVISPVTAHDRGADKPVANLSAVFEGNYLDSEFKVTSSIVKHASLPPIDAIKPYRMQDIFESDIDILVSTCNHIEETARAMASLQSHEKKVETTIKIDWVYQLLTTNALNSDKQASTYGYTVLAANLMDGQEISFKKESIDLRFHVFNAGINTLGKWNLGQKNRTQRRENRKAYLHVTEHTSDLLSYFGINRETTRLQTEYKILLENKHKNSKQFNEARKEYNENKNDRDSDVFKNAVKAIKESLKKHDKINQKINAVTYKIERENKKNWKEDAEKIQKLINKNLSQYKTQLNSTNSSEANNAAEKINQLCALQYKIYMDELYYSGKYREPKNAALFNAYMSAYQRLAGLSASTGCKSANDRTYVARLVLAAMEGRDKEENLLPPAYHNDKEALKRLQEDLQTIAMANSTMVAVITETGGGTPKIGTKKFSILKSSAEVNINSVINHTGKLGQYASHKLKTKIHEWAMKYDEAYKAAYGKKEMIKLAAATMISPVLGGAALLGMGLFQQAKKAKTDGGKKNKPENVKLKIKKM